MKKALIATTLTAVLVLGVGIAGAAPRGQNGPGAPGGHGGMHMIGVFMQLDLTEEQRDQLKAILDTFRPGFQENRAAMGELRAGMAEVVKEFGYNEALLEPIAESIGDAAAESALLRAEMRAAMRDVLTEEQLELLEQILENRDDRPAGSFGRGR